MIASRLIAHRGCALIAPENTMTAMRVTKALGVDWVEVDANLLGDGRVVIFHDQSLERLTDTKGSLLDRSTRDLESLRAGAHFSPFFSDEPIPTLEQLLDYLSSEKMGLNLEIKLYPGFSAADIVNPIIVALEKHWWDFKKLIISSFSTEVLALIAEKRPEWPLGHLWFSVPKNWLEIASSLRLVSVHCNYRQLSSDMATAVKSAGLDLYVYTVNDNELADALFDMGVDGLITDDPRLFMRTA